MDQKLWLNSCNIIVSVSSNVSYSQPVPKGCIICQTWHHIRWHNPYFGVVSTGHAPLQFFYPCAGLRFAQCRLLDFTAIRAESQRLPRLCPLYIIDHIVFFLNHEVGKKISILYTKGASTQEGNCSVMVTRGPKVSDIWQLDATMGKVSRLPVIVFST